MHRIIYASRAVGEMGTETLLEVLATARRRNESNGLTGMLLYSGQSFLQMLEGEEAAVRETYTRIQADPRHTNLRVLRDAETGTRIFTDWSMGFKALDGADLAARDEGIAPSSPYPFLDAQYIVDGAVAETFLSLYSDHLTPGPTR